MHFYKLNEDVIRDFCEDAIRSGRVPTDREIYSLVGKYEIKEKAIDQLEYLKQELDQRDKMLRWYESAVKEACGDDKYAEVVNLFMTYMHNDFCMNTEIGQEMMNAGYIKPSSMKIIVGDLDD